MDHCRLELGPDIRLDYAALVACQEITGDRKLKDNGFQIWSALSVIQEGGWVAPDICRQVNIERMSERAVEAYVELLISLSNHSVVQTVHWVTLQHWRRWVVKS